MRGVESRLTTAHAANNANRDHCGVLGLAAAVSLQFQNEKSLLEAGTAQAAILMAKAC